MWVTDGTEDVPQLSVLELEMRECRRERAKIIGLAEPYLAKEIEMSIYKAHRTGNLSAAAGTHDDGIMPSSKWYDHLIGQATEEQRPEIEKIAGECYLRLKWEDKDFRFLAYPGSSKDEFFHRLEKMGIVTNGDLKKVLDIQPYKIW